MFWRKKKKTPEILFTYDDDPSCRRQFIRVSPLTDEPIEVNLGGEPGTLVDISAGGLACRCDGVRSGEVRNIFFDLPGEPSPISARVQVMAKSAGNICHCQFINLPAHMADSIHHYVLIVQKEEIRRRKKTGPTQEEPESPGSKKGTGKPSSVH